MLKVFGEIVGRIKDELLLWFLAILVLAVVAGLRDRLLFISVLVVGTIAFSLRLYITGRHLKKVETRAPLALAFKGAQPEDVRIKQCNFELRNDENALKESGALAFSREGVGWVCYLPLVTTPVDIIRLIVDEEGGGVWESGPFRPLFGNRELARPRG